MIYKIYEKNPRSNKWSAYRSFSDREVAEKNMHDMISKWFDYGYEFKLEEIKEKETE
jgi:hypothetical protein